MRRSGVIRLDDALQIQQEERELKRPPGRLVNLVGTASLLKSIAAPGLAGHRRVGQRERAEDLGVRQRLDALTYPVGGDARAG